MYTYDTPIPGTVLLFKDTTVLRYMVHVLVHVVLVFLHTLVIYYGVRNYCTTAGTGTGTVW